ncbi:MAG TPA: ATP synthase subunit I [Polyangia bacterium]|nr:ATP synthase subunit I [Polyangia bacterium]
MPPLKKIERANLILGVAITCGAGLLWGASGMLAAGVGAALGCLNFWSIARLAGRVVARVQTGATGGQAAMLGVGLALKMAALFVMVWVAVRVGHLAVLPFSLGLSVFVISIFLTSLSAPTDAAAEAPEAR